MNKDEEIFYVEKIQCLADAILCAAEKKDFDEIRILCEAIKINCDQLLNG